MIDDFSHAGFVKVNDRCVYTLFVGSRCKKCKDVCVVDAIKVSRVVTIDKEKCVHCGLCYAACDNSAIDIKTDNNRMILQLSGEETVEIGCIFSDAKVHVACLSRITDDLIVSLALDKVEVVLKKGNCKGCMYEKTMDMFYSHLERAHAVFESMGKEMKNVTLVESVAEEPHIPKNVIPRRILLSGGLMTPHIPKRDIMIKAIDDNIVKDVPYSGVYNLSVGDECNICRACVNACPQGALMVKKRNTSAVIYFNPSLCTACHSCVEVCALDAVSAKIGSVLDLKPKAVKLIEVEKRLCRLCLKEFYSTKETEICPVCEKKKKKRERLKEFFKEFLEQDAEVSSGKE